MEEGKVAEWEAPCHQYALVEEVEEVEGEEVVEEELDGVSGSDKSSCQIGTNDTNEDRKKNWKVAELEKDQAAFLFSHQGQNYPPNNTIAGRVCSLKLEISREGGR